MNRWVIGFALVAAAAGVLYFRRTYKIDPSFKKKP